MNLARITSRQMLTWLLVLTLPLSLGAACSDGVQDDGAAPPHSGIADYSGLGSFEPLLGVGAVVQATVVDFDGPIAKLYENGTVSYPDLSESPDEWTTPLGLPAVVLTDIEHIVSVGGSARADAVARTAQEAAADAANLEVLAPFGVFSKGSRYEFWLAPETEGGLMTYLAFDQAGDPVPGLGLPDPEEAFAFATELAATDRVSALAELAREMNVASQGGDDGPMMLEIFGSDAPVPENLPGCFPTTPDALVDGVEYAEVSVLVSGASEGEVYGLLGSGTLGWFTAGDGLGSIRGWVPQGESLQLVRRVEPDGEVVPVEGAPTFGAAEDPEVRWYLYELGGDGMPALTIDLTPDEVDAVIMAHIRDQDAAP